MRSVVLLGENPNCPSGFGQQIRNLAEGFRDAGCRVTLYVPPFSIDDPVDGVDTTTLDNVDPSVVEFTLDRIGADVVVCFWSALMVKHFARLRGDRIYYWLPFEGSSLPDWSSAFYYTPKDRVVFPSEFGRRLWQDATDSDLVIPFGIDLEIFRPPTETREALRSKWSKILQSNLSDDSLIVLNLDRNIYRKRWDATFDFIRRLESERSLRVRLIAHTKRTAKKTGDAAGFDLDQLEAVYGLRRRIVYTGFDWDRGLSQTDLAELYALSDLRITTSEGEGFGIPTIECAAVGTPQIINDTTTAPELLSQKTVARVPPSSTSIFDGVLYQTPDVNAMTARVGILHDFRLQSALDSDRAHVVYRFGKDRVVKTWLRLLF